MDLSNINFLAVIVGAIASFAFGSLWYSPLLFIKAWQEGVGISDEDFKNSNMVKTFGGSLVMMIIMSLGMAILLRGHEAGDINWQVGLMHGLYVGLMFVATGAAINILYQNRSLKLWLIDAGYQVIILMIMGAIIGAWA